MSRRSTEVLMTKEAFVLKELRKRSGLTMKEVAAKTDLSDTMISFMENGRVEMPKNGTLEKVLKVYGLTKKSFYDRVRNFDEDSNDLYFLQQTLKRLSAPDLQFVRQIVEMRFKGVK